MSTHGCKPGLSLCMIVRDEQDMLPEFFESIEGLFDELCVVDTGSVDSSIDLFEQVGAKVERFTWRDDFAAARNVSLDMARHEWIMFLDADERPSKKLIFQVRSILTCEDAGAATIVMRNRLPHGHLRESALLRLFRNIPSIRFKHAIHEDITESVSEFLSTGKKRIVHLSGTAEHLGYVRQRAKKVDKFSRDRRMLQLCIEKNPLDWYSRFKLMELARFWSDGQLWRDSAKAAYRALDDEADVDLAGYHFAGEFVALIAQGLPLNDPEHSLKILKRWPQENSAAYLMARAGEHEKIGELAYAMADYRACLNLPADKDRQLTGTRPLLGLSRIAMMAERMHDAYKLAKKALKETPRDPEALFALVSLTRMIKGVHGVKKFKRDYTRDFGQSTELSNALGEDELMAGFPERALSHFQTVLSARPDDASVKLRMAQALLADNRISEASDLARSISDEMPDAWMGILVCDLLAGRDSDINIDMDQEQLNRAMRPWVDAVRFSPHKQLRRIFATNAPALEHVFPWLPAYIAA